MINFSKVTKKYRHQQEAVKDIDMVIEDKEMVFLTGHSGAGKSTILKLIAVLEKPSYGRIEVNNVNLSTLKYKDIPAFRSHIGIVLQNPHLISERTVFENVALPLIIAGYNDNDIGKRVRAALDKVSLLSKENLFPEELSTGEQQRIGLARAVVNKPTLLLADEPTGNLDPDLSREIMNLFKEFNDVGTTVLIATHDVELIKSFNCRTLHIEQGRLEVNNA
jgi:cell division transport system ATP-binding protein